MHYIDSAGIPRSPCRKAYFGVSVIIFASESGAQLNDEGKNAKKEFHVWN